MLAGCVPVVSDRGALPEVVGDAGVVVEGREAPETAEGMRRALALGPTHLRAPERVVLSSRWRAGSPSSRRWSLGRARSGTG